MAYEALELLDAAVGFGLAGALVAFGKAAFFALASTSEKNEHRRISSKAWVAISLRLSVAY